MPPLDSWAGGQRGQLEKVEVRWTALRGPFDDGRLGGGRGNADAHPSPGKAEGEEEEEEEEELRGRPSCLVMVGWRGRGARPRIWEGEAAARRRDG